MSRTWDDPDKVGTYDVRTQDLVVVGAGLAMALGALSEIVAHGCDIDRGCAQQALNRINRHVLGACPTCGGSEHDVYDCEAP